MKILGTGSGTQQKARLTGKFCFAFAFYCHDFHSLSPATLLLNPHTLEGKMCNILILMLQILNIMFLHRRCQDSQANLYLQRVENINLSKIFHETVLIFPELILVLLLESFRRAVNTRCHCFRFLIHGLLSSPASLSSGSCSSHSVLHLASHQLKALQVDFPFPSEFQLSGGTVFHVFLIICSCVMSLQGQYGSPSCLHCISRNWPGGQWGNGFQTDAPYTYFCW